MTPPAIEVADIVRAKGRQYLEQFSVSYQQLKAYRAVERCRTAALGGHKDKCVNCAYEAPHSYNSCRSRCCPKCQAQERRRWLQAQQRDLLNTNYFHVVFTLPHELNPLALTSPRPFLDLLFEASSQTLLEVARDPKWLGAEIGFLSILHTWSQNLLGHYHVHCVVPGGGLSPDHQRWISTNHPRFLLPIAVLHDVFRDKFLAGLRHLYRKNQLDCRGAATDFCDPCVVRTTDREAGQEGLVRLCQAALRRSGTSPRLSRPLHPPHGHIQPPHSSPSTAKKSASAGAIIDTAESSVSCPSAPSSSCDASSCMSCPGVSCASATTACCRTVSENSCCPWRVTCSLPKAASHCLCRRPPTAISGTVPVAAHPCASLNASPPHNSILQAWILHDRLLPTRSPGLLHACVCSRVFTCIHQPFKATLTGFAEHRIEDHSMQILNIPSTRGDNDVPKDYLLNQETAFNIHNPSLDHRDR